MPLILAVDRDRRQVNQLVSLVHKRLNAELVQASTAAEGLQALAGRIPDLILTSSLISPKDDGVLAGHLRELGPLASHVQTLTIPVLKSSRPRRSKSGVLSKLRRDNATTSSGIEGCDPEVFADEISLYLARAAEERDMKAAHQTVAPAPVEEPPASLEGLEPQPSPQASAWQEFEADEYPAVESVDADAAAVSTIERDDEGVDGPPSLDLAYEETVRAAGSFGDAAAKSSLLLPDAPAPAPRSLLDEPPLPAVDETRLESVDEIALELADRAIEEAEASVEAELKYDAIDDGNDAIANVDEVSPVVEESIEEPPAAIPMDRLVALFSDLEPRSIEVMETATVEAADNVVPTVAEATVDELTPAAALENVSEPVAAAVADASQAPDTDMPVGELPANPVLDEEALVLLAEASWKATFRAGLLKDLGLTSDGQKSAAAAPKAAKPEVQPPSPINAATPDDEPRTDETAAASADSDSARKDNRSKKKGARGKPKAPAQDEWGLFDPDQCGFSALVEKLDKVTEEPEERRPRTGTRVRVISY